MKKYMPLNGLRWSRDSGSTLCDTPQNGRSRTGWGVINRLSLPHYFVIVILPFVTFAVCYVLYYLLKKALPQVLAVLCGGRI